MSLLLEEALRGGAVAGVFLLILAAAELWSRRKGPPPEWTRKAVHFAGGLLAAGFPWILGSHWTVLALALGLGAVLWLSRRLGLLQSVHGVERRSEGALYFPVAVYFLFLISAHQPVFYLISVLVLVVADSAAAVLGSTYGRTRYTVETDQRSAEGSVIFFMGTFLIVHILLLLLNGVEPAASVVIAAQIALLVTFFEAISVRGNDNIIIPFGTYYLLVKLTPSPADFIAYQLGAQITIIVATVWIGVRFRLLDTSAAIALSLFFYGAYSLGGPAWALAPAVGLIAFIVVRHQLRPVTALPGSRYQMLGTFYVGLVPAVLFILNNTFETLVPGPAWLSTGRPFYPLFVGAVAAHLALLFWTLCDPVADAEPERAASGLSALRSVAGATILIVPAALLLASGRDATLAVGSALAVALAAPAWFALWRHRAGGRLEGITNTRVQALSVALATLLVLPLHFWLLA